MKKILLLLIAVTLAMGANAQRVRRVAAPAKLDVQPTLVQPTVQEQSIQMRTPGTPVVNKSPKKAPTAAPYYRRPAGAFCGIFVLDDGGYLGGYSFPILVGKPYSEYTYVPYYQGTNVGIRYWDYQLMSYDEVNGTYEHMWFYTPRDADTPELTLSYGWEYDELPILYANRPGERYQMMNTKDNISGEFFAADNMLDMIGCDDLMLSSKSMIPGGRNGDQEYLFTYFAGLTAPDGTFDPDGYYFGKNGTVIYPGEPGDAVVDGIAQAFEKPSHPYVLKQAVVYTTELEVNAPVEMTCKVYRLNEIPAYDDNDCVILPEEPGELIATGRTTVTPETDNLTGGCLVFTLYDDYGNVITPIIDDAILVAVDDYNDTNMADLLDFSALIMSDYEVDEGYGELAYVKYAQRDEWGHVGRFEWRGLNNFFASGTMMTGLSIFITVDNPYVAFKYAAEDGEYTFPADGGVMEKTVGDSTTRSIEFLTGTPSSQWTVTCDGGALPDWLHIELSDKQSTVNAVVTADPLPRDVDCRVAVVRFAVPTASVEYVFRQYGQQALHGDVNGDGVVGPADLSALIDYLLGGPYPAILPAADVNQDGSAGPADLTALIDYLLGGERPGGSVGETVIVNGVSFNMVNVAGGTFMMGGTEEQGSEAKNDELPVHQVTLSDYSIGQTEVTQELWQAVMGTNPSHFNGVQTSWPEGNYGTNLQRPVEMVSWDDCQEFITRLNHLTGKHFRLPTEAEWEYAARGGNQSQGYKYAGSNDINDVAWCWSTLPSQTEGDAGYGTNPVATKAPNELGLYDMSGNVDELCQDWLGDYSSGPQIDPTNLVTGTYRVTRGGNWIFSATYSRVSARDGSSQTSRWYFVGLRLAL